MYWGIYTFLFCFYFIVRGNPSAYKICCYFVDLALFRCGANRKFRLTRLRWHQRCKFNLVIHHVPFCCYFGIGLLFCCFALLIAARYGANSFSPVWISTYEWKFPFMIFRTSAIYRTPWTGELKPNRARIRKKILHRYRNPDKPDSNRGAP